MDLVSTVLSSVEPQWQYSLVLLEDVAQFMAKVPMVTSLVISLPHTHWRDPRGPKCLRLKGVMHVGRSGSLSGWAPPRHGQSQGYADAHCKQLLLPVLMT